MPKSASAVSANKFQLFTEKENIRKGGTLIYAYPLFLAQRMIYGMKKQKWSSTRGREQRYLRPRAALPAAASSVTFGHEQINSKVLLKTDEAFCYFHENGLDV